jgi:hypothetical protein
LKEWESGSFVAGPDFTEKMYKEDFGAIRDDVQELANANPEFYHKHGEKLFRRAK